MTRWPISAISWNGYPPSQINRSMNYCRTTGSPQNNNTPQKEQGPQGGLGQGVFTGWIHFTNKEDYIWLYRRCQISPNLDRRLGLYQHKRRRAFPTEHGFSPAPMPTRSWEMGHRL